VGEIRDRLQAAIATIEEFADGRLDFRLRPPATEEQLLEAEHEFGHRLPEDLRALSLEASAFTGVPLAGVDWVVGPGTFGG